jgi:predicted RNase H-like HicB family nuclease
MTDRITQNVELQYDDNAEMWSAHYSGLETPVSSCGESREEALAELSDAVASYLD